MLAPEASGFLVGPAVFKTDVGAQAPRRVRFPSASAMAPRRSPLMIVALVVLVAALLLAFTLPDREAGFVACPAGSARRPGCGIQVDRRLPERFLIAGVGISAALALAATARRLTRAAEGPSPPRS